MAIARVPPAGAPSATTEGVHSSVLSRIAPAVSSIYGGSGGTGLPPSRSPIGTEGTAGLYTGQVAVRRDSFTGPTPAPDFAVQQAAEQRANRFGLGAEAVAPLIDYFRASGETFPELTNLRPDGTIGGGSYQSAAASRPPLPAAGAGYVGAWYQNTNILIALAAGGLALYLLTRKGKR